MWRNWNSCTPLVGMGNGAGLRKTVYSLLKKLKIKPPYESEIPLVDIYPKELTAGSQKDICIPMFIAVLFIIAKAWKLPIPQRMNE